MTRITMGMKTHMLMHRITRTPITETRITQTLTQHLLPLDTVLMLILMQQTPMHPLLVLDYHLLKILMHHLLELQILTELANMILTLKILMLLIIHRGATHMQRDELVL